MIKADINLIPKDICFYQFVTILQIASLMTDYLVFPTLIEVEIPNNTIRN